MKKILLSLTFWTTVAFFGGYYMGKTDKPVVVNHNYHYYTEVPLEPHEYSYSDDYFYTPEFLMLPQEREFQAPELER